MIAQKMNKKKTFLTFLMGSSNIFPFQSAQRKWVDSKSYIACSKVQFEKKVDMNNQTLQKLFFLENPHYQK